MGIRAIRVVKSFRDLTTVLRFASDLWGVLDCVTQTSFGTLRTIGEIAYFIALVIPTVITIARAVFKSDLERKVVSVASNFRYGDFDCLVIGV